ncbi:MAG TPA: DinB family protein [Anaerolineales bacterium]|nr:DinB family protein [Anaerolineales bacterium]
MSLKEELAHEMESTRQAFHHLLDSVPEALYQHPSDNPAWRIGDVLYHITLGPPALRFEIWMICNAGWLFQIVMNDLTSNIFNRINALYPRHPKRITRQRLGNAYDAAHADILSSLRQINEDDLQKSIMYPQSFVAEIAGEVTAERLFRYVKQHFEIHAEQIIIALNLV